VSIRLACRFDLPARGAVDHPHATGSGEARGSSSRGRGRMLAHGAGRGRAAARAAELQGFRQRPGRLRSRPGRVPRGLRYHGLLDPRERNPHRRQRDLNAHECATPDYTTGINHIDGEGAFTSTDGAQIFFRYGGTSPLPDTPRA
jgi:hypothetical protein